MYSIGMFSKINRITTKTLRHYDEIGLLKPEHVDQYTGYRYYTTSQLPTLHQIITLKQMGLSLQNIKEVLKNPKALDIFLELKEQDILQTIRDEELRLNKIRSFSKIIRGECGYMYTPVIKELPEAMVASMRKIVSGYDEFFYLCPDIMAKEMERLNCQCSEPPYCFNIYHDGEYKDKDIDVEICEAVTECKEDTEILKFRKIDKVKSAVCVLHRGSYSTLREAYQFVFAWIQDNHYKVIDNPRESYIDGIWNKENEADWLTEIQVPIEI